jgi:hypothetical protein
MAPSLNGAVAQWRSDAPIDFVIHPEATASNFLNLRSGISVLSCCLYIANLPPHAYANVTYLHCRCYAPARRACVVFSPRNSGSLRSKSKAGASHGMILLPMLFRKRKKIHRR